MSEEEKQVIKRLKDDIELVTFNGNLNYGVGNLYTNINDLKILLNLISKLQKEIDKEKEKNKQKENKIKNKIKFYEGLKNLNKNESIYSVEELKYSEIVDLLKDLLKEN